VHQADFAVQQDFHVCQYVSRGRRPNKKKKEKKLTTLSPPDNVVWMVTVGYKGMGGGGGEYVLMCVACTLLWVRSDVYVTMMVLEGANYSTLSIYPWIAMDSHRKCVTTQLPISRVTHHIPHPTSSIKCCQRSQPRGQYAKKKPAATIAESGRLAQHSVQIDATSPICQYSPSQLLNSDTHAAAAAAIC
jgi:hypothetical protein